jgi:nucleoside-diphosphate-sugar epimerase
MPAISPRDGPVAVTGCSGFTGAHMVRELIHHGYEVRACIRDASSWRGDDAVQYLSRLAGVQIVDGCDLFTPGSYDAAFAGCSAVFQVAAVLGNSADGKSQPLGTGNIGEDVYNGGMQGTQNVIDSINASSTVKRLVYTSSMAAVSGAKMADLPDGYEWTETDWASDGVDPDQWARNSYGKSKEDTEHLINSAADASGQWDAITMNPAMICGPILFKAQVGQWIEQIGRIAGGDEPDWPSRYDMYYDIIDVRDLVKAHRLAAESDADHKNSHGGPRYVMHGCGGRSALRFGTEVAAIISQDFPSFEIGVPRTITSKGQPITIESRALNDSKKAKAVLGATLRPVEETIRDVVETSIELGIITPRLKS